MKVIKEGNWKNPWSMEATCTNKSCGAVLMIEESDVEAPDYCDTDQFRYTCCVCGAYQKIDATAIPPRVIKSLNAGRKASYRDWD